MTESQWRRLSERRSRARSGKAARLRALVPVALAGRALLGGLALASPASAAHAPPAVPPKCEPGAKAGPERVEMTGIDDAEHQGMVEFRAGNQSPVLIAPTEWQLGQRFGAPTAGKWMVEAADQNFIFVGAPGETVGGKKAAGAHYVYLNTADGICQLDHLTQDDERVAGRAGRDAPHAEQSAR